MGAMEQTSQSKFLPWPGFEPRTLAMNVTTRRPLTPQILIQTLIADKRG